MRGIAFQSLRPIVPYELSSTGVVTGRRPSAIAFVAARAYRGVDALQTHECERRCVPTSTTPPVRAGCPRTNRPNCGKSDQWKLSQSEPEAYRADHQQTLTLENDLASRYAELSLADLKAEVDVSVEVLHRTIGHFEAQGKRVVVLGHSFGALLTTRYLALKGPGNVDRFVIMAGRLDMPREVVDGVLSGVWHHFPGGGAPEPHPSLQPEQDTDFIELRVVGAAAHDRYTERLAGTDLSRVIYVYGTADEQIGRLSEAEVAFLRTKGSTVITVEGGHHGSMFEDSETIRRIVEALQE